MSLYKFILLLFFIACGFVPSQAELHKQIKPSDVDSVYIRMIEPLTIGFGDICYDRRHFDEVYNYYSVYKKDRDTYAIYLYGWYEISLFVCMLNDIEPLPLEQIEIYPDEVQTRDGVNWLRSLHRAEHICNDPIETRIKISIFLKDGFRVDAFMSSTLIDIFNYRYFAKPLNTWILSTLLNDKASEKSIRKTEDE